MTTLDARDNGRLAEAYFKPLADGYLFETPSAWVFGPGRRYFVTEEQKSALLGTLQRPATALRIAITSAIIMVIACGVAVMWWMLLPHANPTMLDALGMGAVVFLALYAVLMMKVRRFLRRIAPIVADAPLTTAKGSLRERFLANAGAIPTKIVLFCLVLWSVAAVVDAISLGHDVARGSGWSLAALNLALAVGLAVYHAWILLYRRNRVQA